MASIGNDPGGRRRILFVDTDGKRPTIRLGKMSKRQAEAIKVRVEHLIAAKISGTAPDDETSRWVANLDDVLQGRLAKVRLIPKRDSATLGAFLVAYINSRTDVAPNTVKKYRSTEKEMVSHFGAGRLLRNISLGDADKWRRALKQPAKGKPRGENTVRKHIAVAKVFFTSAVRDGLIDSNPFADQVATIQPNPEKFYFLSLDDSKKVFDACPDQEWRLIFALCRFGGLRCPSEHLELTWDDVDWENSKLRVHSPKTKRHPGGVMRMVPIFPELRPYLEAAFEAAPEGSTRIIRKYRTDSSNWRTGFGRIIDRAGLDHWPKPFQNLRSTRQTELEDVFPSHVVTAWMGNTTKVARKHYLQVHDGHFAKAAQIPAQHLHESPRSTLQSIQATNTKTPVLQGLAGECELMHTCLVAEAGLEPARGFPPTGF